MKKSYSLLSLSIMALTLSACAGGGGGGSSSSGGVSVTPFTSWSAIQPNTTVEATNGLSNYVDYSPSGIGPIALSTAASFTGAYGAVQSDGYVYLESATISSGNGGPSVSFDKAAGDTIAVAQSGALAGIATGMIKADGSAVALAAEPQPLGWNYQTYGIWVSGDTSGYAGAVSVGAPTAVTGIPATGSGTFSGNASGFYLDPSANIYFTTANMSAVTNFSSRSVAFSTSSTTISPDLVSFAAPSTFGVSGNLNMSGTLTYASGSNLISGSVAATGVNAMTGTATGKFYGPTAQEIGGTYALYNAGTTERLIGGFGGKR